MKMTEKSEADLQHELEERLQFETLLSEISTRYINLPVEQIDAFIEEDQRSICQCLDLDQSALWQWSFDSPRYMTLTHLFSPLDGPTRPAGMDAHKSFPWLLQKMLEGETLAYSTENMVPEAAVDQENRRRFGLKSSVNLPLSVGNGPLIGILTFNTLRKERDWPEELVKRLKIVAQIFGNALARKETVRILLENEMRLVDAMDVANLGFYEMNEENHVIFIDDRIRAILGISPEHEKQGRQFWLSHIHPDDLPEILDRSHEVLEGGVDYFITEYRYMHPKHDQIWIHHRSRVMRRNAAGKACKIIGVMQDITQRKLMQEQLRENETNLRNSQKDLQRLAGKLISVKEEELRRLSRELHDDLTQRLAVLAIEAGKLEIRMSEKEPLLSQIIPGVTQIKEQLISVSEDVHRISRQLHPTILDDLGLIRAVESECTKLMQSEDIHIIFTHENVQDSLPEDIPLCLYRIAQEGLHNIISHAGVKNCEIVLQGTVKDICLTVRDQGAGFDPVEVRQKPGLGLSSMRERVQLVGGHISIDSRPGKGTTICASIPVKRMMT